VLKNFNLGFIAEEKAPLRTREEANERHDVVFRSAKA